MSVLLTEGSKTKNCIGKLVRYDEQYIYLETDSGSEEMINRSDAEQVKIKLKW